MCSIIRIRCRNIPNWFNMIFDKLSKTDIKLKWANRSLGYFYRSSLFSRVPTMSRFLSQHDTNTDCAYHFISPDVVCGMYKSNITSDLIILFAGILRSLCSQFWVFWTHQLRWRYGVSYSPFCLQLTKIMYRNMSKYLRMYSNTMERLIRMLLISRHPTCFQVS